MSRGCGKFAVDLRLVIYASSKIWYICIMMKATFMFGLLFGAGTSLGM